MAKSMKIELSTTFKHVRKSLGFSLKEAASEVVPPQFLSLSEKGDTSISHIKLLGLLGNIGIDYPSFDKIFNLFPNQLTVVWLKISALFYNC